MNVLACDPLPVHGDTSNTGPLIAVRDVGIRFGTRQILQDVSFDIRAGSFVSIIGPSGSEKTTLLRVIGGLVSPTGGHVLLSGQPLAGPSRKLALVFQDYGRALLPWRTVQGNVELALEARGVAREQRAEAALALIHQVGLSHAAKTYPRQLSGGMQQRTQIARALAQEPELLLMDEPFGALDAMTRQTLQDEVLRIASERKMTVVFVTHDLEEAIYLGDEVVALGANPGRVADQLQVRLPKPRDQLTTREDAQFLEYRHHLYHFLTNHGPH